MGRTPSSKVIDTPAGSGSSCKHGSFLRLHASIIKTLNLLMYYSALKLASEIAQPVLSQLVELLSLKRVQNHLLRVEAEFRMILAQ